MINSLSDDVLLHIFTFVHPLFLYLKCSLVNKRWCKLINLSTSLWLSWDKYYPFLLPHIPTTYGNIRRTLLHEIVADEKWRKGRISNKNYFEAHRGTMLLNMSLFEDKLATSANDHLVKLWHVPTLSYSNSYVNFILFTQLYILIILKNRECFCYRACLCLFRPFILPKGLATFF